MTDRRVVLYDGAPDVDATAIAEYLEETVPGLAVEVRPDLFSTLAFAEGPDPHAVARAVAACRVVDLHARREVTPMQGEVGYEERMIADPSRITPAVLYDGERLSAALRGMLPAKERSLDVCHVAVTPRLVATFGEDGRYHARVVVCAYPSLVSTTGLVEAPARPREWYMKRQALEAMGAGGEEVAGLKEQFEGAFVDHGDGRIAELLAGYALQAVVFAFGPDRDPFCDEPACRLFNAHTQAELLTAQAGGLCGRHEKLVRSLADAGP